MLFNLTFLLQAGGGSGNAIVQLLFFGGFFAILYFLILRPQMKRQREQKSFEESLIKGTEVVTSSGIIGKINSIEDGVVNLEVGNKLYIKVLRTAISKEMTSTLNGDTKE